MLNSACSAVLMRKLYIAGLDEVLNRFSLFEQEVLLSVLHSILHTAITGRRETTIEASAVSLKYIGSTHGEKPEAVRDAIMDFVPALQNVCIILDRRLDGQSAGYFCSPLIAGWELHGGILAIKLHEQAGGEDFTDLFRVVLQKVSQRLGSLKAERRQG